MLTKYFTAKIQHVGEMKDFFHTETWDTLKKTASTNTAFAVAVEPMIRTIELDPSRHLYIVNHSVSAYEYFGPNDNHDAFPDKELRERHHTFVGKPVTVDHISYLIVGSVLDSIYVEPTDPSNPLSGHYVQNVLAVDKKKAEMVDPNLVEGIINGTITDTSMGALAKYSQCSVCGHVAHTEHEYCTHIASMKGQVIRTASGEERKVFEICHDFEFFEDSIIRPLEYGGLAGGRGADPKAKILMMTAGLGRTAAPKLFNVNTDQLQNVEKTNDHEVPDTDDIIKEIEKLTKPKSEEHVEILDDDDTTKYEVENVKEGIEDARTNRIDEKHFEVIVYPGNLMRGVPAEEFDTPDFRAFLEEILKTSSTEPVSDDKKKAFERIRELVSLGVPDDMAIKLAWEEQHTDTVIPAVLIDIVAKLCGDTAEVSLEDGGVVVTVSGNMEIPSTCTVDILTKIFKGFADQVTLREI